MNEIAGSVLKLRRFSYAVITGNEGNLTSAENTWTFFFFCCNQLCASNFMCSYLLNISILGLTQNMEYLGEVVTPF